MNFKLFLLLFLLASGVRANESYQWPAEEKKAPVVAGEVALLAGRPVIMERDIVDYQASQGCYDGGITSRQYAFMRLLEAAIAEHSMKAGKKPVITEEGLEAEAARIDRETRAPEVIACIKKYFESAPQRYKLVYVRPVLVESKLREFLGSAGIVQAKPKRLAEQAFVRAKKGESLEALGREPGLAYSSATYSLEVSTQMPAMPGELMRYGISSGPFEQDFIRKHLLDLKPGELKGGPVETDSDFRLLRLLSTDGTRYKFEWTFARKHSQEDWFGSLPKADLAVKDADLYSWLSKISGNPRLSSVKLRE